MTKEKIDRAFPMQYADDSFQTGMTLRDYFAVEALNGLLSASSSSPWSEDRFAKQAYAIADAMLEARK